MNQYEKIDIEYTEIGDFSIETDSPFILNVNLNNVKYEFLIKINSDSENLLFLGSGSYDPNKLTLPVFQRHAWIEDFSHSVIYYNDPTLYLDKITLGWGNGTQDRHYLKELSQITSRLIEVTEYKRNNVYYYGSSAGGFMSLMLAGYVKGTTAIVNNPQTIVANFWPNPVKEMIEASYNGMELEDVIRQFAERINVIEFYKKIIMCHLFIICRI